MNSAQKIKSEENLVWIDMEMTGLDPVNDQILEVACLITDSNLKVIAEHPSLVIHQPDEVLKSMNDWCIENHTKTGLVAASERSNISLEDAERQILEFIKKYTPAGKCPLAGNSVYMDRLFLRQHMPLVENHLHYRIVDVSTIKELCRRWHADSYAKAPRKKFNHRALMDIKESIQELRYYRSAIFKDNN
ncbi:oligoribonuclease, mitochondrial isoform X2 [Anabrus simplex]|uniref:oligoribonuclease, mitochondrial isoform X2 n=2 Tax=Anabrus simplex TaxID=316456 RepID=UPI0035A2B094